MSIHDFKRTDLTCLSPVVNGTVAYSSLLKNETVKAMNGMNLTITVEGGNVFVDSAKVITPNVLVSNGVVHIIDKYDSVFITVPSSNLLTSTSSVLNPANTTATPNPSASSQSVAFAGASSAGISALTSGIPAPTSMIGGGPTPAAGGSNGMSSSSSKAAAMPMKTAAVGAAALFAGAGVWLNN